MKTTFLLSKIYLKELINSIASMSSGSSGRSGKGGKLGKIFLFVLLPILLYPQLFVLSYFLFSQMKDIGLGQIALSIFFFVASMFTFVTVFSSVLNNLGGDKALNQLLSLPIKPRQIFTARILLFYFITFFETIYLVSPTAILYAMDYGWHTLPITLILSTLIPVIPICIALLVIMPFAKVFAKSRLRKILPYVLNIGFLVVYLWVMSAMNRNTVLSFDVTSMLLGIVERMYIPALWAGNIILGSLIDIVYFVGINLIFLALVYLTAGFFAGVILSESNDIPSRKGKAVLASRSVMSWLLIRQFKVMFSSHRFVLQCLGSLITLPILIVFYIFAGLFEFQDLYFFIHHFNLEVIAVFALVFSPTLTSSIAISSVAREGMTFWENKLIPVSSKTQVLARFLFSMLLNLPIGIVTAIVLGIMLEISLWPLVFGILAGVGYVMFFNSVDHLLDLRFPNLQWTNEMQAVKNSKGIAISVLFKFIVGAGLIFGIYYASQVFLFSGIVWMTLLLGIALGLIGVYLLFKKGVPLFDRIDA